MILRTPGPKVPTGGRDIGHGRRPRAPGADGTEPARHRRCPWHDGVCRRSNAATRASRRSASTIRSATCGAPWRTRTTTDGAGGVGGNHPRRRFPTGRHPPTWPALLRGPERDADRRRARGRPALLRPDQDHHLDRAAFPSSAWPTGSARPSTDASRPVRLARLHVQLALREAELAGRVCDGLVLAHADVLGPTRARALRAGVAVAAAVAGAAVDPMRVKLARWSSMSAAGPGRCW
jgi:hypothetical protein